MRGLLFSTILGLAAVSSATAQTEVLVSSDITTNTTWTSNNQYNLQRQIYVRPGATLTIQAGTVVASTTNLGGSLAVTRGGMIVVEGTQDQPVIMTSKADVATWAGNTAGVGGDPRTGTWREAANEWGNLTIMGRGYMSENAQIGNVSTCNASNTAQMEGLVARFPGDPDVVYGGGDDNDDSGSISFLSIRYGGFGLALNNELNGLSLGAVGAGTDIHHVEIMNNIDDGIEIWGGCVDLKYFSIWNVGDDSLDIDQGWRGRGQFGLIVQGYSVDANQGSGVGDNACEVDGAEDSDWEPRTSTSLLNMTIIGQPQDGDGATAWRDNANVQYRNSIIMDCGEKVVRFDNIDGDGANGYGHNGTSSWLARWTTSNAGVSFCGKTGQLPGNQCQISNTVLYNNVSYGDFNTVGANNPVFNNVVEPGSSPINSISRAAPVARGGLVMERVVSLDPTPANDALTNAAVVSGDSFFDAANFCGAFRPGSNWMVRWTAAQAFGFLDTSSIGDSLTYDAGKGMSEGPNGDINLAVTGSFDTTSGPTSITMTITNARPVAFALFLVQAGSPRTTPFPGVPQGLQIFVDPLTSITKSTFINGSGTGTATLSIPTGLTPGDVTFQGGVVRRPSSVTNVVVGALR